MAYPDTAAGRLMEYVGLPAPTGPDGQEPVPEFVSLCADEASALVYMWLKAHGIDRYDWPPFPDDNYEWLVLIRAELEVGAELYHRKNTKNAVAQFASPDGSPVRIARDPMVAAYPLLRQLVGGGFA